MLPKVDFTEANLPGPRWSIEFCHRCLDVPESQGISCDHHSLWARGYTNLSSARYCGSCTVPYRGEPRDCIYRGSEQLWNCRQGQYLYLMHKYESLTTTAQIFDPIAHRFSQLLVIMPPPTMQWSTTLQHFSRTILGERIGHAASPTF